MTATRTRRPGPWPIGFLGMLALLAGSERVVSRVQDLRFTTIWAQDWRNGGQLASKSRGCEVLCLGDSLVKFGLAPKLIERRLGLKATNLASCVGQPPAAYYLLKRALKAGARPKVVIVDFTEHLLATGPRKNLRHWPEILSVGEILELAEAARDPGFFGEMAAARISPTVKDRSEIRNSLMAAFRGESGSDLAALGRFWRNWNANRGAQLIPKLPTYASVGDWFRMVYPPDWHCHPVNYAYIRRFLRLAESEKIAVVWLLPPYKADFQAICESNGVDGRFARMVRGFRDEFPGLVVADGRKATYPDRVYAGDPIHLDFEGATSFSDDVAAIVSEVLDRRIDEKRWVAIPDFRPRPYDPVMEHLGQSAERIATVGNALRR